MYIVIIYFPVCDAISFEIKLSFLIKPFFFMTTKSGQKFKYLQNEKSFLGEKKKFIIFKGLSVVRTCLRPDNPSLISFINKLVNCVCVLIQENSPEKRIKPKTIHIFLTICL